MRQGLTSSGILTATKQVTIGASEVYSVTLVGDGASTATLTIYDSEAADPTQLGLAITAVTAAYPVTNTEIWGNPVMANRGIYAVLTTSGTAKYIVHYART